MNSAIKEMSLSYIRIMGNPVTNVSERELIVLLPAGCYWAKKHGSCSYCGYQPLVDEFRSNFGEVDILDILKSEVEKQTEPFQRISFFVGGSFLEIPKNKQLELFNYVDSLPVSEVFIETRPELVTENNVSLLKNSLTNKILWVAIGLESSNEEIRNRVHNKGIDEPTFLKAMEYIKNAGTKPFVYVFLKPPMPYISDKSAYDDAFETVKYSFNAGAEAVEIESGYIVEGTYMQKLYNEKKYEPLRLWTILKLIKDAHQLNLGICRLAYFSDTPEPLAFPGNCSNCTSKIVEQLQKFRETMDYKYLDYDGVCDCKNEWAKAFV